MNSTDAAVAICSTLAGQWSSRTNSGRCVCPVRSHADAGEMLSVGVNLITGKLLVRCPTGCKSRSVISALRKRGLWPTVTEAAVPTSPVKGKTEHEFAWGGYWYKDKAITSELDRMYAGLERPSDADLAWYDVVDEWDFDQHLNQLIEEHELMLDDIYAAF